LEKNFFPHSCKNGGQKEEFIAKAPSSPRTPSCCLISYFLSQKIIELLEINKIKKRYGSTTWRSLRLGEKKMQNFSCSKLIVASANTVDFEIINSTFKTHEF